MKTYDVLVLGGGTAGSAAAKAAHDAGARTAMFNDGEIGGLCILRGCMPTKTMLHSAHVHHARGDTGATVDFGAIMANKDAKVARFQRAKAASIAAGGYELIDARARFVGVDEVEAGGERYRFTKGAVIATGSVPTVPALPGLDSVDYWTSDDLMQLTAAPESVLVLGTGAIGIEFAQFFARLGTRVVIVSRRPILADVDPLITAEMQAAMRSHANIELYDEATAQRIRPRTGGGVELDVAICGEPRTLIADHLILATGRRAAVDDLDLPSAGIEMDGTRVRADSAMRTTNPRVFVAGDATGDRLLLHVANWEGKAAGLGAAQVPGAHAVERRLHVEVVFFDPALATVGLTEAAARAAGHDVITASIRFAETGRAITMDVGHGAFKLVAERATGELLGAQILGPRADDIVHIISTAMYFRATAANLLEMPWYHPTLSEVILTLARTLIPHTRPGRN